MLTTTPVYTVGIDDVQPDEWAELLLQFEDASLYQSWSYGAICWGADQLSHLVLRRDGSVVAMAQVRVVRLPVIRKGIAYVRWGPLCRRRGEASPGEVLERMLRELKVEYVDRRGLMLRLVPNAYRGDESADTAEQGCDVIGFRRDPTVHVYRTMRLDLTTPLEALQRGLHPRWRNYLKNAQKSGYRIIEGASVELYDTFLVLYRQMMARKQFDTTVDVEEFKRLQAALPGPLKMHVFVCEKDGQALNALVVSAIGDTAIYLLAATGDEGLKGRGAYLLQWHAVQHFKARGCRWYDVGGINPEKNPGVFQFKSGLGGQEVHQLGGYGVSRDWICSATVACGERLQRLVRHWKLRRRKARALCPTTG